MSFEVAVHRIFSIYHRQAGRLAGRQRGCAGLAVSPACSTACCTRVLRRLLTPVSECVRSMHTSG
jgi:hypothetical protein